MKKYIFKILFCLISCFSLFYSCGKANLLTDLNNEDSKQKAADNINSGNYDSAIALLLSYTSNNLQDYSARSMLANAYMLKGGINILNIIVNITSSIGAPKNNLYVILNAFSFGTLNNISYLNSALQNLAMIPSSALTSDQKLQTAIANAALALLTTSLDVVDPTTKLISSTLVANMPLSDANTIYNSLLTVQSLLLDLGVAAGSGSGTGILLNVINGITSSGGGTNSQKLATYLYANA